MRLFKIWLAATIISMSVYTPIYVFSDNAVDAIENITPHDLIPFLEMRGADVEGIENALQRLGVDTTGSLEDSLEDNARLSNVEIDYADSAKYREISLSSGLLFVIAKGELKGGRILELVFGVRNKAFLRNQTEVHGLLAFQITDGTDTLSLSEPRDVQMHFYGLFMKRKIADESVEDLEGRFNNLVALHKQQQEEKAQREARLTPPPIDTSAAANQPESSQSVQEYFAEYINASVPTAQRSQPQEAEQRTIAGNLPQNKIVIFQFEGQPAFCADEGEDGVNCHGDASAFIGQGTYKDFMDVGSTVCIASEPGCKMPQYFPEDIKG